MINSISYPAQCLLDTDRVINARNLSYRRNKEQWKNLLLKIAGDKPSKYAKDLIEKSCQAPNPDHILVISPFEQNFQSCKQYWKNKLKLAS